MTIFFTGYARAGQAIYNSVGKQTLYGNNQVTHITVRGYFVFDPDTLRGAAVGGLTVNHLKVFVVVPMQKYRVDHVTGPNGSSFTIIAKAESPGTQFAGTLLETGFQRGRDRSVTIDSLGARLLPRTFFSSSKAISRNTQTNIITASEATGSATLDINASRASNLSETFDAAVSRLTTLFIARGYTQFTPPPAN